MTASLAAVASRIRSLWEIRNTRIFRHLIWSGLGQMAVAAASLIGVRILTELAAPDVFGTANMLSTTLLLLFNIGVMPVGNTQLRYHSKFTLEGDSAAFAGEILKLAILPALVIGVLAASAYAAWTVLQGQTFLVFLALLLLVWPPIYAVRTGLLNRAIAERRQGLQSAWQAGEAIAIIAATALLLSIRSSVEMFLAGNLLAVVAVATIIVALSPEERRFTLRGMSPERRRDVIALIRSYGLPFVVIGILSWVGSLSDRYVLAGTMGVAAVGFYAGSFGIASRAMQLVAAISTNAFRPALFEAESHGDHWRASQVYRAWVALTVAFGLSLLLFFFFFTPTLAELLLAEPYRDTADQVMTWIAFGFALLTLNQVIETRIMSLGNTSRLIGPLAMGAATNAGMALVLIPAVGIRGAAIANATGFLVQLSITYIISRRLARAVPAPQAIEGAR
ncbi:MAG: lipopolysaccharide biosynthesis protein [Sphingosinicella sp.]|uniref:lipopolysaccharide biosynthesis protein n=1 Tax=Sphingosinicella sp. TaxID=1917971 RepID=UPI004037C06E